MTVGGYIVAYVLLLGCAAICVMKGKRGLLAVGLVLPFVWVLGVVADATPESLWAWTFGSDATEPAG
ncbi:MAG TPA: hypothetical protein VGX51_09680 [Solirubrobacteraceae bacterium]|jgi:uncharacterized membrane protein|nr:hypothetical protein [Solirubrobacteraceae bacterium]